MDQEKNNLFMGQNMSEPEEFDEFIEIDDSANLFSDVPNVDSSNNISNVINKTNENTTEANNKEKQQNNSKKDSGSTSATSSSNSNKDSVSNKILGTWKASKVVDSSGNDLGLSSVWGSGIEHSNEMIFKEKGVLSYMIGITASSDDGEYTVNGNTIKYGVPTDTKGVLNWQTLTYIPGEDILREEINSTGEKQIVTYVRAN